MPETASAADTGWKSPTTGDDAPHGDNDWDNPNGAFSLDTSSATETSDNGDQGYGDFGFGSLGTIQGIEVRVNAWMLDPGDTTCQLQVRLWNESDEEGWTDYKTLTLNKNADDDTYITFGGAADLWGNTWTAGDFDDDEFAVEVRFNDDNNGNSNCETGSGNGVAMDHLQVKVHFAEPAPQPTYAKAANGTGAGNILNWTITITNTAANNVARNDITVTDAIATGTVTTSGGGTCTGGNNNNDFSDDTIVCDVQQNGTLTINFSSPAPACGAYNVLNQATFAGTGLTGGNAQASHIGTRSCSTAELRTACGEGSVGACIALLPQGAPNQDPPAGVCSGINANFVIDVSFSVNSTELGQMKNGINAFGDILNTSSKYSISRYASYAQTVTSGYVDYATFDAAITALGGANTNGIGFLTWTEGGINTGITNNANPAPGLPPVMFIVTDGSPNLTDSQADDLTQAEREDPLTWTDAAIEAINAANSARSGYWVRVVRAGPADANLENAFSAADAQLFADAVMDALAAGEAVDTDFDQIAQALLASAGCDGSINKTAGVPGGFNAGTGRYTHVDWTVTVTNNAVSAQTTTVTDANAPLVVSGPTFNKAGGSCTAGDTNIGNGLACTIPGASQGTPGIMTLTVRTALPPDYDICAPLTGTNSATASGQISGTSNTASFNIPASTNPALCDGTIIVNKEERGGYDASTGDLWSFTVNGSQSKDITDEGPAVSWTGLTTPGDFTVAETGASNAACSPTSPAGSFETYVGTGSSAAAAKTDAEADVASGTRGGSTGIIPLADGQTVYVHFINVPCARPDVKIEKTESMPETIQVGADVAFTITVTNLGPGVANDVEVTDSLSAKVDWDIPTGLPVGWSCAISSGVLTCEADSLAEGAGNAVTITLTGSTSLSEPNSCGPIANSASVSAANEDSTKLSNNTSGAVGVTVLCPDLDVSKRAGDAEVPLGDDVVFVITVTNDGDGVATDFTLSDPLPTSAGLTWQNPPVLSGLGNGTCSINGSSVLECSGLDLDAEDSGTVTVTATTTGATTRGVCGAHRNDVVTVTILGETSTGNNAQVFVVCPTVDIQKSANPVGPVFAGEDIGFDLVVTATGGTATNVQVEDTLPGAADGVVGVTWSTTTPGCSVVANQLSCTIASVSPGGPVTIHVTGTTTKAPAPNGTCRTVTNEAATAEYLGETDTSGSASVSVFCPDPKVEKSGNGPVTAGDNLVYTITVTPQGSGTQNVTLTDTLPGTGLTWAVSGDTTGAGNCVPGNLASGAVLSCTWNDLQSAKTITLTAVAPPALCGPNGLENTATISSAGDVDTSNNEDDATITVECPDVVLDKATNAPLTVNAGETISFTITATNNGEGEARGFVLLDNLDPDVDNWQIVSQTLGGSATTVCVIDATGGPGSTPRLECPTQPGDGITLASDAQLIVTIKGTATPAACGTVTNEVTATSTNHPGTIAPDSADVEVLCPDISVNKVADPSTINAGETAKFVITIDNIGTGTAQDVMLEDAPLPGVGLTWTVTAPDGVLCKSTGASTSIHESGDTLQCDIGILTGDADPVVITLTATPGSPANCGPLENNAIVLADNESSDTDTQSNNSDDATVSVNCALIDFTKTTTTPTVSATDAINFTIRVENDGAGTATNVVVTDVLPGTGLVWTLSGGNEGSCTSDGADGHNSGETLTCTFGNMEPSPAASSIKTVTLTTTTTVGSCPEIENVANLTSGNAGSGQANAEVTVNCPKITVTKTATGDNPVDAGGDLTYDIAVAVSGPAGTVAKNVVLKEEVPANTSGWAIVSITGDALQNGTCTQILNSIICDFGNLTIPADGQLDYLIKLSARAIGGNGAVTCEGGLTNWAIVQAGNAAEAKDDATVNVDCPDVDIDKVAFQSPITAGEEASFTIEVTNDGTGTATVVEVEDELPAGVSWSVTPQADAPGGEGCWILAGTLYCKFAELAPGQTIAIKLTASTLNQAGTAPAYCGYLNNDLAEVFVGNDGITGAADSVEDVYIEVVCPDVTVVKEPDAGDVGSSISAGEDASFTIEVTNDGPGAAANVSLDDNLPMADELVWQFVGPKPAECAELGDGDVLDCTWPSLASGSTVTVRVFATIPAQLCGELETGLTITLDNTATVGAINEVPDDEAPNSDTGQITVNCGDVTVTKRAIDDTIGYFDVAEFEIVVRNVGPGTANNITVEDTLPAGGNWGTDHEDCFIPNDNPGLIVCNFEELAPYNENSEGPEIVIRIFSVNEQDGRGAVAACGELNNVVDVVAEYEPPSATENNSASATIDVECGTIQVVKVDQVPGTTPNKPEPWEFTVTGPNEFEETVTIAGSGSETIVGVPLGEGYTVVETQAGPAQCPTTPSPATWTTSVSPSATQDLLEADTTITFTFTNAPCGEVLDTGALIVEKVRDVNGNGVKDPEDTMISNWPVTISGPQFNVPLQATTNAQGIIFLPSIESGVYTVTEGAGVHYAIVGVRTNGGALSVSNTTQVEIVFGDDDTVTFYNQPRGSIVVTKSTIVSINQTTPVAAPNDDDGWQITLSSVQCGINVTQSTGQNGTTTFSNLPLCSDYRVSENPVNPQSPGYQPVGATVLTNLTPGHPVALNVTFVNRLDVFDGCLNIADCGQPSVTPTATNTPTNTPTATPTNTPENTPEATPTPDETVAGDRTPGPGSPTPQAPDTGAGLLGGPVGGMNMLLVVAGLAALAIGTAFIGFGRRSRGANRQG